MLCRVRWGFGGGSKALEKYAKGVVEEVCRNW